MFWSTKAELNQTRLTLGSVKINYPDDVGITTKNWLLEKFLLTVSFWQKAQNSWQWAQATFAETTQVCPSQKLSNIPDLIIN